MRTSGDGFFRGTFGPLAARKLGIELAEDLVTRALDVDVEGFEDAGSDALPFAEEPQQNVLRADIRMVEGLRFLPGEREDFFHARRVRNTALGLRFLAGTNLFLHGIANGLEIEPHFLENAHSDALAQLDQPEQNVLGADVVVVEAVGFLAGEREHLLGSRREVIHRFLGHRGRV